MSVIAFRVSRKGSHSWFTEEMLSVIAIPRFNGEKRFNILTVVSRKWRKVTHMRHFFFSFNFWSLNDTNVLLCVDEAERCRGCWEFHSQVTRHQDLAN